MEEYVEAAIACGLKEMIFLEHMEEGIRYYKTSWLTENDFDYYHAEGRRLRVKYARHIRIGIGVEVGYNPAATSALASRLAARQWDRIGISYHYFAIPGEAEHLNMLSRYHGNIAMARAYGPERILDQYFAGLLTAIQQLPGTVLCHLDAALRHVDGWQLTPHHFNLIDQLLATVRQKGIALEINTSGLPLRGAVFPRQQLLQRALAYDIPLVAGSDAHSPQEVGRHFSELPEIIDAALSASPRPATRC